MKRFLAIAAVIPALAFTASAQDDNGQVRMMKMEAERMAAQAKIVGIRSAVMGKTVKDAPYSATEITESNASACRRHAHSQRNHSPGLPRQRRPHAPRNAR